MIAGFDYASARRITPGLALDVYLYRRQYDDAQHGIRRNTEPRCAD